ncbi:MAG: hypothetical protein IPG64_16345, partial [Haliea sp.]|nr:hypothetical protein [Haliea sp.]
AVAGLLLIHSGPGRLSLDHLYGLAGSGSGELLHASSGSAGECAWPAMQHVAGPGADTVMLFAASAFSLVLTLG